MYSQSEEDYLEALYVFQLENEKTRVKDVASALDVKMPSVVAAVKLLSEKGLVEQEKYGPISLTEKGRTVGKDVYERHKLFRAFFHEVLGLDKKTAEEDACRMEHFISSKSRERLLRIVEYVRACQDDEVLFIKRFMHFVNTGEMPPACPGCPKGKALKNTDTDIFTV